MGRSVGDAAAQAVRRSKEKPEDRTPAQIFKEIRNNLASRLAVTPDDVRFLLAEYDKLVIGKYVAECASELGALAAKALGDAAQDPTVFDAPNIQEL